MTNHIENRKKIIQALRDELVGPCPDGREIDCRKNIEFDSRDESYGPWCQQGTKQEILVRDRPIKRYGVGVLYPKQTLTFDGENVSDGGESDSLEAELELQEQRDGEETREVVTVEAKEALEEMEKSPGAGGPDESDDFDLSTANTYRPGSMGVSFLVRLAHDDKLIVSASGGRYRRKDVYVKNMGKTFRDEQLGGGTPGADDGSGGNSTGLRPLKWWLRDPVKIKAQFTGKSILKSQDVQGKIRPGKVSGAEAVDLDLHVELYARPHQDEGTFLVTVCLINRTEEGDLVDEYCLFQSFFEVAVDSRSGSGTVLPYPSVHLEEQDEEEKSLALLYREAVTYAVGHGCAADWHASERDPAGLKITAECLPTFQSPSTTPDIRDRNGKLIEVRMDRLAGLVSNEDGFGDLSDVVDEYEAWIDSQEERVGSLTSEYREPAARHLKACYRAAGRMREGLEFLEMDADARQAFQLANHAMLLQQVQSIKRRRGAAFDAKENRWNFSPERTAPDPLAPTDGRGKWRAFQIAFLLACLRSTALGEAEDRSVVELIWFPTGGGKTEAYLGLAAFSMFLRRLRNPDDSGTHVLTRYTLRMLTAQQFQRAATLLCAMDILRRQTDDLGQASFSIGIWVGGSTTPNLKKDAKQIYEKLQKGNQHQENLFLLTQCPWCAAEMGPLSRPSRSRRRERGPRVIGYERVEDTVAFACPDNQCEFTGGLPVYVVDEDIYEKRPSFVIGTVDKFALLAWRPQARSLFGIDADGHRNGSPPGLIIQDELHLISGPLGSVTGLYEIMIEELCTDRRPNLPVPPKMICSTATIRRYKNQVRNLYGRETVDLFPPPGLDVGDSFFSQHAKEKNEKLSPGRIFVGVNGPGLGSLQTAQVRTFATLSQAPVSFETKERDPWWTQLIFFNSMRELGTSLSLLQSDIPDYLKVLRNRTGVDWAKIRGLRKVVELTGRLRGDEVPRKITELEVRPDTGRDLAVDVCLASSIIEVGIDIDRLSLMCVVGQPKNTSQYIQVTGRVGRRWWERPGLVVTIYGASRPRDRSHFERFRTYHERLYAQVEPTSVTPFSPPVLERALHAVMVSYARLNGDQAVADSPLPFPESLLTQVGDVLLPRVRAVDPKEEQNFLQVLNRRKDEWRKWERPYWEKGKGNQADVPLLRNPGEYVSVGDAAISWATPLSMRDVDAECQVEVTRLYLNDEEGA